MAPHFINTATGGKKIAMIISIIFSEFMIKGVYGIELQNFLDLTFKQMTLWEFDKKKWKERKENGSCIYNLGLFGIFT